MTLLRSALHPMGEGGRGGMKLKDCRRSYPSHLAGFSKFSRFTDLIKKARRLRCTKIKL